MNIIKNVIRRRKCRLFFNRQNKYYKTGDFVIDFIEGKLNFLDLPFDLEAPIKIMLFSFPLQELYNSYQTVLAEIFFVLGEGIIKFNWQKRETLLEENPDLKELVNFLTTSISPDKINDMMRILTKKIKKDKEKEKKMEVDSE